MIRVGALLVVGILGLTLFQNCESHSIIDGRDYNASNSGGPAPQVTPTPAPAPTPAPFVFENKWKPLAASNPPPALFGHTAVLSGNKVILWGGQNSLTTLLPSGGFILDLAQNTWSAFSGGPSARTKHMAVWTGQKMIVWGGQNIGSPATFFNDGGTYDPATGMWTPIAAFGLSPRQGSAAVWTGTVMIVWGGVDVNNNAFSDGAMYNPATNSWSPLASAGAPSARKHPMAVWTGTRMLVWGGANGAGTAFYNDGASYDPLTNTWTALSQTSAPPARQWSSVDFSFGNSLMFLFGGHNGAALGDGYSFDLVSNAWTATSATGAPSARYAHSAVMTPHGVLIYGGTNGSAVFSDGNLYY